MSVAYCEPVAASAFSFLDGASMPGEMVARAYALGMRGIGVADRNTVAGVVRAHKAWREVRAMDPAFRLIVGARLRFTPSETDIPLPDIAAYPTTRAAWARLTRLLTIGNRRAEKGDCTLDLADLLDHAEGLALVVMPGPGAGSAALLGQLREGGGPCWLAATMPRGGRDARALAQAQALSAATGVPLIAGNDPLYATAATHPLADVLAAIRLGTNVQAAGRALAANAERHLKSPAEMARLFTAAPEAIAATQDLFAAVGFTLDELAYEYPHEPVPAGWSPQAWLEELVRRAAAVRFPKGLSAAYEATLAEEFRLIRARQYAPYFLTVHDIVAYARGLDPPILCQGRGSAANSLVCWLLGVTPVDPVKEKLLFSRFLSDERDEPPDIDVDFEHERREEVIQYIYRRYGRERAGIAATVIHYRQKSALREAGKALGLSEDVTARLAGTVWGSWGDPRTGKIRPRDNEATQKGLPEKRLTEAGFTPDNPEIARLRDMAGQLLDLPRHLSQHVGGFVLTQGRLDELVPIHNAAMPDRTFIEWDKDDIDALGLMKVDVLALGMLTAIRKCFDLVKSSPTSFGGAEGVAQQQQRHHPQDGPPLPAKLGEELTLATIPTDDAATFAILQRGDSMGTFQVESRAQIAMLPRMKPACLYDLVIQVAIVRPGPIQGGMVHPYLRRRNGEEAVVFPSPAPPHDPHELREVLGKTLGVPLFQEQAMKLAIVAARFTPAEADGLRRAMATFRHMGTMPHYHGKLVGGMMARGYTEEFAERCFEQIKGFGEYGFPESHAQAFGWLAYVSSWLKCHHPAAFCCALLNSQPMGFYAPAQLVADARAHGVEVLPIDVTASDWDNGLETIDIHSSLAGEGRVRGSLAIRLGLRQIDGFRAVWAEAITAARATGGFASIEDLARRAQLPPPALKMLADADALGHPAANRRESGWPNSHQEAGWPNSCREAGWPNSCREAGWPNSRREAGWPNSRREAGWPNSRREAGWQVRRIAPAQLPLFAAMAAPELAPEPDAALPAMPLAEEVAHDYQTQRLSLRGHPLQFLREGLAAAGVATCAAVNAAKDGARRRVAGAVLVRQRPGKGNAIFITIEDETGIINALMWARNFEEQRAAVMAARLMVLTGQVQRSKEGVVHLMVARVTDASHLLRDLGLPAKRGDEARPPAPAPRAQPPLRAMHPRDVRLLPPSRDFH